MSSATGDSISVTTATASGGDTLRAAASTFTDKDIVGALGMITAGGAIGVSFEVIGHVSETTIRIRVLSNLNGFVADGKLPAATTTSSSFTLILPGKAVEGATNARPATGFAQRAAVADDKNKFGFVLKRGLGFGRYDASGTGLMGMNLPLAKATGGQIVGRPSAGNSYSSTIMTAALDVGRIVAYGISVDVGGSNDGIVLINAAIPDQWYSPHVANLHSDFNSVTVG